MRVRRDLTSAIGIRKAGQVDLIYRKGKRYVLVPMGEPLRRLCACGRHLSAIRGVLVFGSPLVAWRWVQFDSDYSVEDDASPIFSLQVRCLLCEGMDTTN